MFLAPCLSADVRLDERAALARRLLGNQPRAHEHPEHARTMEERILSFLSKLDSENEPPVIEIDTDLFETGILDSFGFVELLGFLEKETGRSVTEEEMDDPRFNTVAGIVEVMSEKPSEAPRVAAGGSR
jgi:acyl carrier protein